MIILGGAYVESVTFPHSKAAAGGSGLRAALALGQFSPTLFTAVAEDDAIVDTALNALAAPVTRVGRSSSVGFSYLSPVSTPEITGAGSVMQAPLNIDADNVLVFGMVESGAITVRARRAVLDPQSPRGGSNSGVNIVADQTVWSANVRELGRIIPPTVSLEDDAQAACRVGGYEAVLVRAGARGCLVADGTAATWVGASPTTSVWSLGSGDTFSAAFAHAFFDGADPIAAAHAASNSTAWWCSTREPVVPQEILSGRSLDSFLGRSEQLGIRGGYRPKVYLAGPFFSLAERWLVETARQTLHGLGADVFSPVHEVGSGGDEVAQQDIAGLERCDVVFALLDGFDPGTVYEIGWAARHGIPIVGYTTQTNHEGDKMMVGLGAELHRDFTTALYRAVWAGQGTQLQPGRFPAHGRLEGDR